MIGSRGRSWRICGSTAAAGVAIGTLYTISPTTLWFLLLLPLLFLWAQRDLATRERRWVLGLLALAVAARLVALSGFFLAADQFKKPFAVLIPDERFMVDRSLWMLYLALGHTLESVDYMDRFGHYGRSGLQDVLAVWQLWFGPAPYGAHLLSVAMWLGGAIALHRTARRAFGPLPALGGFVVVLFMPTLFVWSISTLKEPPYFFLTAMTMAGAMTVVSARHADARLAGTLLVACAVAAIATVRSIALVVTSGGLILAAAGWIATRRAWLTVAAVLLIACGGSWGLRQPAVKARVKQAFAVAATTHWGHVTTPGYGYRLLDPHFYPRSSDSDPQPLPLGAAEAERFAMRAAVSFFAVPLPWKGESWFSLALLPQQLAWYGLAGLAGVGMIAGWRRDAAFTWVLVGNAVLGAAIVALFNGNVGTLVRMRDSVVPVIVWLSALGGCGVLEWAARRFSKQIQHGRA